MERSKTIEKEIREVQQIEVYKKSPNRCHPNCFYCVKEGCGSDGLYDCTLFEKCIDGHGDDVDGYDHYGFLRCQECIDCFGLPSEKERSDR